MENASNALIMAGGVLIGVLILTLAVYLYTSFGTQAQENYELISQQQIVKFNTQFTKYGGRNDLTIYDVVSAITTARANNQKYSEYSDYETDYKITVYINNQNTSGKNVEELIKDQNNVGINEKTGDVEFETTYSCDTRDGNKIEYYNNGRIKIIRFTSN